MILNFRKGRFLEDSYYIEVESDQTLYPISGTSTEMQALAHAIETRVRISFDTCAVSFFGMMWAILWNPQNEAHSTIWAILGEVDELSLLIKKP